MIYQSDWQHRRSSARGQAVRRHYQQRPVHLKPLARLRQTLMRTFESLLTGSPGKRRLTLAASSAGLVALVGMVVLPVFASVTRPDPVATQLTIPLELPPPDEQSRAALPQPVSALESDLYLASDAEAGWQVVTVRRNETLGNIFGRLGLSATTMHRLLDESESVRALTQIHPGDQIAFRIPQDGQLTALQFDRSESQRIVVELDGDQVSERIIERELERRTQYGSAVITSSLFGAGDAAGISDLQVMRLAEVFNYDIDFAQDLREGDSFAVVYESIYRDGVRLRDGDILAAVFVNQGKRYEAYRYTDARAAAISTAPTDAACARLSSARRWSFRASPAAFPPRASTRSSAACARTRASITPRPRERRSAPLATAPSSRSACAPAGGAPSSCSTAKTPPRCTATCRASPRASRAGRRCSRAR
ncbi:MAG: hypothetical protein IPK27_08570 [Rhodanobacteraceae bacterium]|nr:hypothetical protein [Rhodanobacteraceae bacterium]